MDKKQKSKIFKEAADIINDNGWCKKHYAISKNNTGVDPLSENACSFCVIGSLTKAISNINTKNKIDNKPLFSEEQMDNNLWHCLKDFRDSLGIIENDDRTNGHIIADWNDYRAESKSVVVEKLINLSIL